MKVELGRYILQVNNRKYGGAMVTVPAVAIKNLGLKSGDEVLCSIDNGKLVYELSK